MHLLKHTLAFLFPFPKKKAPRPVAEGTPLTLGNNKRLMT